MSRRLELFHRRVERLFDDKEEKVGEGRFNIMIRQVFHWLFRNLLPLLFLVLIINVTLMFVAPVEVSKSKWFWLNDLFTIVACYAIFRIFRRLSCRNKSDV